MSDSVPDSRGERLNGHWLAPGELHQELAYESLRALASQVVPRWLGPIQFEGMQFVPEEGPGLLISNHHGTLDPIVIAMGLSRHVHFVADAWLGHSYLAGLLKAAGALILEAPHRSRSMLAQGEDALRAGHLVGVFPEGMERFLEEDGPVLGEFHQAFARLWLAVRDAAVPVLPVGVVPLHGTMRIRLPGWWLWGHGSKLAHHEVWGILFHGARVCFGPPLRFRNTGSDQEVMADLCLKSRRAIADLMGPWANEPAGTGF